MIQQNKSSQPNPEMFANVSAQQTAETAQSVNYQIPSKNQLVSQLTDRWHLLGIPIRSEWLSDLYDHLSLNQPNALQTIDKFDRISYSHFLHSNMINSCNFKFSPLNKITFVNKSEQHSNDATRHSVPPHCAQNRTNQTDDTAQLAINNLDCVSVYCPHQIIIQIDSWKIISQSSEHQMESNDNSQRILLFHCTAGIDETDQIENVPTSTITHNANINNLSNNHRNIKLDRNSIIRAFEHRYCSALPYRHLSGYKIALRRFNIQRGIITLIPECVEFLGGFNGELLLNGKMSQIDGLQSLMKEQLSYLQSNSQHIPNQLQHYMTLQQNNQQHSETHQSAHLAFGKGNANIRTAAHLSAAFPTIAQVSNRDVPISEVDLIQADSEIDNMTRIVHVRSNVCPNTLESQINSNTIRSVNFSIPAPETNITPRRTPQSTYQSQMFLTQTMPPLEADEEPAKSHTINVNNSLEQISFYGAPAENENYNQKDYLRMNDNDEMPFDDNLLAELSNRESNVISDRNMSQLTLSFIPLNASQSDRQQSHAQSNDRIGSEGNTLTTHSNAVDLIRHLSDQMTSSGSKQQLLNDPVSNFDCTLVNSDSNSTDVNKINSRTSNISNDPFTLDL